MNKFKIGTSVFFVDNDNQIREGVIDMVFDFSDSLIINADGVKYKRRFNEIVIKEEKPEEPVKSEEPKKVRVTEKPVVTISREEFVNKGAELCAKIFFEKGPEDALKMSLLIAELSVVLFTEVKRD